MIRHHEATSCVFRQSEPGFPATLDTAACAPFRKERRMKFAEATKFHRKSGGAKWRDLRLKPNFQWAQNRQPDLTLAKLSLVESADYAVRQAGFLANLDSSEVQASLRD
jgi:hypothetical protein